MGSKILILGKNGQLGKSLTDKYPNAEALGKEDLDISDVAQMEVFDWSKYDTVINAAAYVNADESETNEGRIRAWNANTIGPKNLTIAAGRNGFHLIHISSEYVFDGEKSNHLEDESFSPLSVYGQTKAAGDVVVSTLPNYHILRTTWVVGDGHNFVKTMFNLANMRIDPKVVNDQFGRLTFTSEIVRAIDYIIVNRIPYGTYNISNTGAIKSWAEIAADVYEKSGHDRNRVVHITTEEYSQNKQHFAPRPKNSDLNLMKIQSTGFVSNDYAPLLDEYIQSLMEDENANE